MEIADKFNEDVSMKKSNEKENILGYEKIGKLIKKFSIPCIISLLVNSLYNIVDQIFIGWGVGYLGNGATNVVFPITMIALAFSLMFGDGTSAYLSLKLGEKKKDEAKKGVGNGTLLSLIVAVILFLIGIIFMPQLLDLFGCTEVLKEYALNYGYVIIIGIPFMMIGTTLNSIIRADGNPKYSMLTMVSGAILNIILDPIFIFIFKMGVSGAAIATIISQFLTFILNLGYIKRFKSITIQKSDFKLSLPVAKKVSMLGISSFITQMSVVLVIAFENNLLSKYGAMSKYGAEIPITVLGIVMKISQILNSIIIGISVGAQPILGFNYGATKFDRVKKTIKYVIFLSLGVSTFAFILFQTIPDKLISIFGSGDELYNEFACLAFRTYLMLCICNGIQMPTGIFFQAIGKSSKSAFISLSRQILFLIPSMVILGARFGINGVLYSGPVADFVAFVIAVILLVIEIRILNKKMKEKTGQRAEQSDDKVVVNESENNIDTSDSEYPLVITISREYGSGGRYVGKLLAEMLNFKLYDKEIIKQTAKNTGLNKEYIETLEQTRKNIDIFNNGYYVGLTQADELFVEESKVIQNISHKPCVIIGRCADFILKNRPNTYNIFIYSSYEDKLNRVINMYKKEEKEAKKDIAKINKLRENHYKYYTKQTFGNPSNYDLCINSDTLGVEKTAKIIYDFIEEKIK